MHENQSLFGSNLQDVENQTESDKMQLLTRRVLMNLTKYGLQRPAKITSSLVAFHNRSVPLLQNCGTTSPPKQKLLRYPALPLDETMKKFLKSVQPLLTEAEMKETVQAVDNFRKKEGAELQTLLENVAKKEENWLAHRWLRVAYLQFRAPVTAYSSPSMSYPIQKFKDENDYLLYAGKVVYGMAKYKLLVDRGEIPVVKLGKNELDNSQFGVVYGTCRIPQPCEDGIEYNPKTKHVAVIYKNHFYKLNVYNNQGVPLHPETFAMEFKKIMELEKSKGVPYGVLSTDSRDNWAAAYEELLKIPGNKESVQTIQKSMFTVSLDECVPLECGKELDVVSQQLIHGGGSKENSGNRWMDKTIQLIINPNGISGYCYEHSPAEGQPVAIMADYVTQNLNNDKHYEDGACDDYECPKKLELNTSECLNEHLMTASENVDKMVIKFHEKILHYQKYGKEFLKGQKLSPDSYIQMALQLAFYSMYKFPTAQYESAHLRIYAGGRTETIRSCSIESVAFAKAMTEGKCSDAELVGLLRKAVDSHREYTTMALQGRGVDRHLLGLKLMAIENNLPLPEFFKCPGFVKSLNFRVASSQVASPFNAFMSYGPSVDDGYGCCYNPRKNDIYVACGCWRDNKDTDADKFAEAVSKALDKMWEILTKAGQKPAAKL